MDDPVTLNGTPAAQTITANTPGAPMNAAERVFAIPELLEKILLDARLWADFATICWLFTTQRVSRRFVRTITSSPLLRRTMFLEHDVAATGETRYNHLLMRPEGFQPGCHWSLEGNVNCSTAGAKTFIVNAGLCPGHCKHGRRGESHDTAGSRRDLEGSWRLMKVASMPSKIQLRPFPGFNMNGVLFMPEDADLGNIVTSYANTRWARWPY